MKKLLAITLTITACAALCAPVWPQTSAGEEVPADTHKMWTSPVCAEALPEPVPGAPPDCKPVTTPPIA